MYRNRWNRLLIFFLVGYSAVLFVMFGAQAFVSTAWWPVDLFVWAIPFTITLSIFSLFLSLRLKRIVLAGFFGVILLASYINVRNVWADGANLPYRETSTYVVMTHNTGNGLADPQKLVQTLRSSGADIIGLQEITTAQAEAIDRRLADIYPYRILFGDGIPGKGLLSKYPILSYEQLHFYPDRPDLMATIQMLDGELTVIIAHPPPPRFHSDGIYMNAATRRQLDALLSLATQKGPVIMLGDFNMTALSQDHLRMRMHGLVDAYQVSGQGPGFTLPMRWRSIPLLPMARVDYIWHSDHFHSVNSWIGDPTGSDHLPVFSQIQWKPAQLAALQ